MYAIIEDSGTQIKVAEGDVIEVDPRDGLDSGALVFEKVLVLSDPEKSNTTIGSPYVSGASVKATIVEPTKGPKLHVIKYKRRKGYRRKTGHRQSYLRIKIDSIKSK